MESIVLRLWRIFSGNVLRWIEAHGRETGYDIILRNGEQANLSDILWHPIGWAHDMLKYSLELYFGITRGKISREDAMELCFKIAHVAQLAGDGMLGLEMMREYEQAKMNNDNDIVPDEPRPDFYGPVEPLQ